MKKKLSVSLFFYLFITLALVEGSMATVLDFEVLDPGLGISNIPVPYGYGGFVWEHFDSSNINIFNEITFNGAVSGETVVWNGINTSYIRAINSDFDFVGAWFTSLWMDEDWTDESFILYITAVDDGVPVLSREIELSISTPRWFDYGANSIDELIFYYPNNVFIMDDFTFNLAEPINQSTVPEPSTLLLLGAGLAGLVGLRRFRG